MTAPAGSSIEAPGPSASTGFRDGKRYLWLLAVLVPTLPGWSALLVNATSLPVFWFFTPFYVYAVIPFLDLMVGSDPNNPSDAALPDLERDRFYRYATYAFIPLQYAVFFWAAWLIGTGDIGWIGFLGLSVSIGVVGGIGINTAHELGHKKTRMERRLSKLTLLQVAYGHFYVEHNKGHHKNVATPEDPASARFGESFYAFWPRTVIGSWRSAWEIERRRLERKNKSPWSLENEVVQTSLMTAALYAGLIAAFGPIMIPFLAIQAVVGFSELELVNYLEHYGLARQKTESGRYERVRPEHSWNSNHLVTNLFLYHLQRHSDHHANPTRRYQALRHYEESPQLPAGYASMMVLAAIPPLWRRIIDHRVVSHYNGDMRQANLQPSRRERILAHYGCRETPAS